MMTARLSLSLIPLAFISACTGNTSGYTPADARIKYENLASITTSNFLLTLSAAISPPSISGTTLDADDVFVNGTNTYATYNIPGAAHMGAIDLINTSIPILPTRTATATFATSTVNSLYVNTSGTITIVGSTNNTLTSGWPAYLSQLTFSGSSFSAPTNTMGLLNTYAGTAITSWNNMLYALSGTGGASTSYGLSVINPTTLATLATVPIVDARGLGYYAGGGTDLFVIAGGGNLYDINSSNTIAHTIALGGNTIAQSKSTVQVGKTMVAASLGDGGAKIICQADQKTLATIPAVTVNGLDSSLTVTNAITAGPGLLFTANGEGGVYVYTMVASLPSSSVCNTLNVNFIGSINLGSTTYSANNVRYSGGSLFIATGAGGFQVVTVTVLSPLFGANLDFM